MSGAATPSGFHVPNVRSDGSATRPTDLVDFHYKNARLGRMPRAIADRLLRAVDNQAQYEDGYRAGVDFERGRRGDAFSTLVEAVKCAQSWLVAVSRGEAMAPIEAKLKLSVLQEALRKAHGDLTNV